MAILRIFCIIATTLGLHVASTSPTPPLSAAERTIAPTNVEFLLVSPTFRQAPKIIYWFSALAEITTILAQLHPHSSSAQLALSALTPPGRCPTPRLTLPLALGALFAASGAFLRFRCYRALGRHFTFETGIINAHELITRGPYSVVRHPGYTGAVLAYMGLVCCYGAPGSWFLECVAKGSVAGALFCAAWGGAMTLVVGGLIARIDKEDAGLRSVFGEEWDEYAERVPYALIPGIV
ncbi:hypothetical protein FB45DRAFT_755956 [Roridomyces roridus]|uniref:Protein-S-isoprenylcysteine O-methyltransferase n=1 Tax=Roridomyces roridus TaxID=1738132 RepID=A0AAD7FH64_9AGAR|nr:hypothetical protein FB45DRAFT_755956 [Roridomyces roridus]